MQFYIVDVFAEAEYTGNQLGVFRGNPTDTRMQRIAQEMGYSETTFITSDEPLMGGYEVRIFTPANELPFAGHPTLGTAYIIREELIGQFVPEVVLHEKVGPILVTFEEDGTLWMRQNPPQFGHIYEADLLADVLGLVPDEVDTRYPVQEVSTGVPFIIVPLKTLEAVQRATMNLPRFQELLAQTNGLPGSLGADAVFLFAPETVDPANDVHARAFVHLHGIPEDPATGAANGDFAAWLVKHRYYGNDPVDAQVEQGYEIQRPSLILLRAQEQDSSIEIRVGGRVRLVARGEWSAGE